MQSSQSFWCSVLTVASDRVVCRLSVALAIYSGILSLLMVTRIPLLSNKLKGFRFSGNEYRFILAGLTVAMLVIFGIASAPLIIPVYILVSVAALYLPFTPR